MSRFEDDDETDPFVTETRVWRGQLHGTRYSIDNQGARVTVVGNEVAIADEDHDTGILGSRADLAAWAALCSAWRSMRMGLAFLRLGLRGAKFGRMRPYLYAAPRREPVALAHDDDARIDELECMHDAFELVEPIEQQLGPFRVSGDIVTGTTRERHAIVVETATWLALTTRNTLVIAPGRHDARQPIKLLRELGQTSRGFEPAHRIEINSLHASAIETAAHAESQRSS